MAPTITATTRNENSSDPKVAVITGGSRGIGYNVAKTLIARGVVVVIGDILDEQGQTVVQEFNKQAGKKVAAYIHTDVTKYKDILAMFALADKEFGGIDIAIVNAGIAASGLDCGEFSPFDDEADMHLLEVNVGGVIKCNKVALMYMAKRGRGTIINTASIAGIYPMPGLAAYAASKHAVIGWTRSLAHLPKVCNVRVNAVCPFWVQTNLLTMAANGDRAAFKIMQASEKARMEDVIKAFLQCIDDPKLSGATLSVLPDGIHFEEAPAPRSSMITPRFKKQRPGLIKTLIQTGKEQFKAAVERSKL